MSTYAVGSLNQGTTQCYQAFLVFQSPQKSKKTPKIFFPSLQFKKNLYIQKKTGRIRRNHPENKNVLKKRNDSPHICKLTPPNAIDLQPWVDIPADNKRFCCTISTGCEHGIECYGCPGAWTGKGVNQQRHLEAKHAMRLAVSFRVLHSMCKELVVMLLRQIYVNITIVQNKTWRFHCDNRNGNQCTC